MNKNYLLHPSDCPSGSIVRGDGVCTENVHRSYGADANPSTDPLGGGVGYSGIVDPNSADFIVSTRSELLSALSSAKSGQIIYVTDSASINLTGDSPIAIPAGVTLASGRGRSSSLGALIYSNDLNTYPLFSLKGENTRVTGLRLQGPDPERKTDQMTWLSAHGRYYDIPNSFGIWSQYSDQTVDNCELFGWSQAAIYFYPGSTGNYVHNNYIHNNQREGLGYGVSLNTGSSSLIEANIFDWNRHSIAGSRGSPDACYEARYNLLLDNGNFDMHGGNDVSDPTVIHHNTLIDKSPPAVEIRGIPTEGVWVYKNWAVYDMKTYTEKQIFTQSLNNLPGHTPYEKMSVYDNWYGTTPPDTLPH